VHVRCMYVVGPPAQNNVILLIFSVLLNKPFFEFCMWLQETTEKENCGI